MHFLIKLRHIYPKGFVYFHLSMKKFILILPAMLLFFVIALAQKIKYEKSLEEAQKISHDQNKPLAILITIQPPSNVTNFMQGLSDKEVATKFNDTFVNFKIDRTDTASRMIIRQYHITLFPALVFFDSKGGFLFKDAGGFPTPQKYLTMADQAIYASKEKSLIDFDNEYKSGHYNAAFLKDYINKREKADIIDNAALIEKYVDFLSVTDLDNYNQVLFILKAGPLVDGKPFKLAHINRKIIDSIFKTEPLSVRTAINNLIAANTTVDAIATKNITKAIASANYTRTTLTTDFKGGQQNYALRMLQYYYGIKDTANLLRQSGSFYDYYMNISADSLRRMDQKNMEKKNNAVLERAKMNIPEGGALESYSYIYAVTNYGSRLNSGAYSVYKTGTKNTSFLIKAMLWSKRSIELSPVSAYYDTLAHLLYRLEFYSEAESTQKKAIELGKKEKRDVKALQDEYEKIQKKTL